ncbi:MAG: cardiolipin synthase [Lachnospiraceae bacterium]|nr:cardiolipin synthase [Lachnospiraceae bacterium]
MSGRRNRDKHWYDWLSKITQALFNRVFIILLLLCLEIGWAFLTLNRLSAYYTYVRVAVAIVSFLVVWGVSSGEQNPAYKLSLSILILAVPMLGIPFYVLTGDYNLKKRGLKRRSALQHARVRQFFPGSADVEERLRLTDERVFRQTNYLKFRGFPAYDHTEVMYLPDGAAYFDRLIEELKKAEHFIFIEYFIIARGQIWDRVLDVLKERAAAGVEIRLLYDDFGCVFLLPYHYEKKLARFGIIARVFNPLNLIFSVVMNHRDHRKVVVIDGNVGFTGGINIGDNYANITHPYGEWKDNGVMLRGEGVWNLTGMFLEMWNVMGKSDLDYEPYRPDVWHKRAYGGTDSGYVQPYADDPMDNERVGETVYLQMLSNAKKYAWIMTPYLIIDNEMMTALTAAAKSGVDVRIITPGIPDKKLIFLLTQSYYGQLIRSGVRIYQFTPGFVHAKTFLCDDEIGTVGSVNLDFRSLYLHYECGTLMYRTPCLASMKRDFEAVMGRCEEITDLHLSKKNVVQRAMQAFLRLCAPLL